MTWETVIGLEVHTQLNTQSKIFSKSSTRYGAPPNTQADLVDLAMPGTLPVLNEEAVKKALLFGLAIDADIPRESVFERKNYFYPDLPKGYQTSQFAHPIVGEGQLTIVLPDNTSKTIGIIRAHLEEDAGKSLHEDFHGLSGIDLNRAGTPLLEIVSAPDLRNATEAVVYLKTLHAFVRYLGISDGNMQEGSFRCDVNISIKKQSQKTLGTRTELKNLNSFRFIERAIYCEAQRHIALLEKGQAITQETRLYDEQKNETRSMRSKEEANDYRYFPCPDLLPVEITPDFLNALKEILPEHPEKKAARFIKSYQLNKNTATEFAFEKALGDYFEQVVSNTKANIKTVVNWLKGELAKALNQHQLTIEESKVSANDLAELLTALHDDVINGKTAKDVFITMWQTGKNANTIIKENNLEQVSDTSAISQIVNDVIKNNPQQVAQYQAGKVKVFAFFIGQIMKATNGKASPKEINKLLRQALKKA